MRYWLARLSCAVETFIANQSQRNRVTGISHPTGAETVWWEGTVPANSVVVIHTGDHRDRYLLLHCLLIPKTVSDGFASGADVLPGPPGPLNASHMLRGYTDGDIMSAATLRGEILYTSLGWDGATSPGQYHNFCQLKTRAEVGLPLRLYAANTTGALEIKNDSGTPYTGLVIVQALPQLNALVPIQ